MRLGDVLKKERERKKLSVEQTAAQLGLTVEAYSTIEGGGSPAEIWGPRLAEIAIRLEVPTSRLLAESGRSADTKSGQAGRLIREHRERRQRTVEQMADALGISSEAYEQIEAGTSELETYGPLLLRFAELIEQPVFNLFYPCGLPFAELDVDDYP